MSDIEIINQPQKIYLCLCDKEDVDEIPFDFRKQQEVTWSEDEPVSVTIPYVLESVLNSERHANEQVKRLLIKGLQYIEEAKAIHYSGTDNSLVDDWIKDVKKVFT